mmetsp:Transcript_7766/g.27178  ORF Transcript_7766/g.27178 Transcript_7766/m.27178 type:complete len:85 (-) Transcript_7766:3-257(-)
MPLRGLLAVLRGALRDGPRARWIHGECMRPLGKGPLEKARWERRVSGAPRSDAAPKGPVVADGAFFTNHVLQKWFTKNGLQKIF